MSQLGNQTTGFTFTISGSFGDVAGGSYTVPSPGIFVNQINVFADNNGSSSTDRLYVWIESGGKPGAWLLRSGTFSMGGSFAWQRRSDINVNTGQLSSDGYLPTGTKIWVGIFSSTGILAIQGSGSGTAAELGNTADGNWNDHGPASGPGQLAAYIDYTALAAPTLTNVSPATAPAGQTVTLTGTNLRHTSSITVCGVNASTFTITDDSHITVTIPAGASGSGTIVVTTPAGTASIAFTAGQVYWGTGSGVSSIVAVKYGDASGNGTVHTAVGIWAPVLTGGVPTGVKRIW